MKLFVGAKALIENPEGKFLIVREGADYDEGTELGRWDVVGGRIEPEEPLLEGLRREVYEESGLNVEVDKMVGVTENFPVIKGEKVHIIRIYYHCQSESMDVLLSSDHDKYEWVFSNELESYDLMEDVKEMFQLIKRKK